MNVVTNRKNHIVSGLVLTIIALVGSLLLLEIFVRLFLRDKVDTELLKAKLQGTSIQALVQPSENPAIFFELKPNLNTYFHSSLIVTSSQGYRISSHETKISEAGIRIAVLGDSTSFGWRVDYEDTYPEKFRQQMEIDAKIPIELRNYSVPGYNSNQEYHLFLDEVVAYQPNLVILHYDHNDPQATGAGYPPNYIPPEYGDNALHSLLLKFTLRQVRDFQNRTNLTLDENEHRYYQNAIISGPLYNEHLVALQNLAAQAQSLNIPTVVIIFDTFIKADKNWAANLHYILLHEDLVVNLERMGFYVLDLYPSYQTKMQEMGWSDLSNWWVSKEPVDGHPNAEGHQFIADRLVDYIRSQPELMKVFAEYQATTK